MLCAVGEHTYVVCGGGAHMCGVLCCSTRVWCAVGGAHMCDVQWGSTCVVCGGGAHSLMGPWIS